MDATVSTAHKIADMLERRQEFFGADCALREELVKLQHGTGTVEDSTNRFLDQLRAFDRYSAAVRATLRGLGEADPRHLELPVGVDAILDEMMRELDDE